MKLGFSRQIFEKKKKSLNITFHENTSSGGRVPFGRMDMTKPIVAFRSFSNARKKESIW
jgi:hypothetical protein